MNTEGAELDHLFVAPRSARDRTLALPAVQVNQRAGRLPAAEDNGLSYLKITINLI